MNLKIEHNFLSINEDINGFLELNEFKNKKKINTIFVDRNFNKDLDLRDYQDLKVLVINESYLKNVYLSPKANIKQIYVFNSVIDFLDCPMADKDCYMLAICSCLNSFDDHGQIANENVISLFSNMNASSNENLELIKQIISINEKKKLDLGMLPEDWFFEESKTFVCLNKQIKDKEFLTLFNRRSKDIKRLVLVGWNIPFDLNFENCLNLEEILMINCQNELYKLEVTSSNNLKNVILLNTKLKSLDLFFNDNDKSNLIMDNYIIKEISITNAFSTNFLFPSSIIKNTEYSLFKMNGDKEKEQIGVYNYLSLRKNHKDNFQEIDIIKKFKS